LVNNYLFAGLLGLPSLWISIDMKDVPLQSYM